MTKKFNQVTGSGLLQKRPFRQIVSDEFQLIETRWQRGKNKILVNTYLTTSNSF